MKPKEIIFRAAVKLMASSPLVFLAVLAIAACIGLVLQVAYSYLTFGRIEIGPWPIVIGSLSIALLATALRIALIRRHSNIRP